MAFEVLYNAHHSPLGAFASLTLGARGQSGGLGVELKLPPKEPVYVGVESRQGGSFDILPFFDEATEPRTISAGTAPLNETEGADGEDAFGVGRNPCLRPFTQQEITRTLLPATDSIEAGDLCLRIYSPIRPIPAPDTAPRELLEAAVAPVVPFELVVDNRGCPRERLAFFGYAANDPYAAMHRLENTTEGRHVGIASGRRTAVVALDPGAESGAGFHLAQVLLPRVHANLACEFGAVRAIRLKVPADSLCTFRLAACFHRNDVVTSGLPGRYLYRRFFESLEDVASYAGRNFEEIKRAAAESNERFAARELNQWQRFQQAQALRSYCANTQLLDVEGRVLWVVNEGEYRIMNTLDLTVDQMFLELKLNPWVQRNVLDLYLERYSYTDEVVAPDSAERSPGGLAFTHDMGMGNAFCRPGYSAYECQSLEKCFSYMACEELLNWTICAVSYALFTRDSAWLSQRQEVLRGCLTSLENRDHPLASQRAGTLQRDSSRASGGSEITTYDSLDQSLGQARWNLYLTVKSWACYVLLEEAFTHLEDLDAAARAREQALRASRTVTQNVTQDGTLPAILDKPHPARVISAVEGLAYPAFLGLRRVFEESSCYRPLVDALRRHLDAVLRPGVCLFENGGWKLSSTSQNSWLSKVYLCQWVAEHVLGISWERVHEPADEVHARWLTRPENSHWCWSDQMLEGKAVGSRHYPRGVTSLLWLHKFDSEIASATMRR